MAKCNSCGRFFAEGSDGAKCKKCSVLYHKTCYPDARNNNKWICKDCKTKEVCREATSPSSQEEDARSPGSSDPPSLAEEMKLLRAEISIFRHEMSKYTSVVEKLTTRMDSIEERMTQLETRFCADQAQVKQSSEINGTINLLKKQLNDSEQDKLLNDVEISGLQENSGENLLHVVITLAQKIGLSLEERDIVNAYRLGARISTVEHNGSGSEATERPRPRPVVVRLTRRYLRDEFLHAARVRRGVDTAGMGLGGEPRRFYVNEHLTRINRKLFYTAREELARKRNWRFVWTRGGIIYARRDQKSSVHVIRSEDDLSKVFGIE